MASGGPNREAAGAPEAVAPGAAPPAGAGGGGGGGGSAEKVSSALTDALVKAIAYLATGAGFLTFVGATGAAVTWMRLNAAQLPATQALQLVGIKHLVADGAVALVVFAVMGLIAVTLIYVIDMPGRDTDEMRHGLTVIAMCESLIAIWLADHYLPVEHEVRAYLAVIALGVLTIAVSLLPEHEVPPPTRREPMQWLRRNVGGWAAKLHRLPPTNAQLRDEIERRRLRAALGLPQEEVPDKWRKGVRLVPMLVLFLAASFVGFVCMRWFHDWVGWSIWLAWGLAGLCFGVARTTERFWPYGLAVFFSVALFGAWLNVVRLTDSPELSPAALLRTGNGGTAGVVGLYIARTDDRYWLGAVTMGCKDVGGTLVPDQVKRRSGRIFSIPRSQVVDDTVGARAGMKDVGDESLQILGELVQRQPPGGAPPPALAPASSTATPPTGTVPAATAPAPVVTAPAATGAARRAGAGPKNDPAEAAAAVPRTLAVTGRCMHPPPRLARLSPPTAAPGEEVEIVGTDLGDKPGPDDRVTVDGTPADVAGAAWHDGGVVFRVPPRTGVHDVAVRVVARDLTSNALVLKVARNRAPAAPP